MHAPVQGSMNRMVLHSARSEFQIIHQLILHFRTQTVEAITNVPFDVVVDVRGIHSRIKMKTSVFIELLANRQVHPDEYQYFDIG